MMGSSSRMLYLIPVSATQSVLAGRRSSVHAECLELSGQVDTPLCRALLWTIEGSLMATGAADQRGSRG